VLMEELVEATRIHNEESPEEINEEATTDEETQEPVAETQE